MDTTYNGWTNRETWLVGVHDFFDYEEIKEVLKDTVADQRAGYADRPDTLNKEMELTLYLADWLEHEHEIIIHDRTWSLDSYVTDHLNGSIGRINWIEIANHYQEEIREALQQEVN